MSTRDISKCKACDKDIDPWVLACPHCGEPLPGRE